jgi:rubrerythrin
MRIVSLTLTFLSISFFVQECVTLKSPLIAINRRGFCSSHDKLDSSLSVQYQSRSLFLAAAADVSNEKASLIKLPILQIIKGNEITGEFICGNDLPEAVEKFEATLSSLQAKIVPAPALQLSNGGVRNIYSEDQLTNELDSYGNYVILKLYREGCKKCALLEPIVDKLSRDPRYSEFLFLQAEVSNIEKYTTSMKERLLGIRGGNTGDCSSCSDTGFVVCTECAGMGYIKKGSLAAFCPICTGYKKTRCNSCGGKCLKCG